LLGWKSLKKGNFAFKMGRPGAIQEPVSE